MAQRSSRSGKSETQGSGKEEDLDVVDVEEEKEDPQPEKPKSTSNELEEVAQAVLRGEYGTGQDRRLRLSQAGYDARAVEREVVRITNRM